jgi:GNAT superfamily N-acetyltransferase
MDTIRIAQTDDELVRCFPVMSELRPHLSADEFVPRIRRMEAGGFLLAYLARDGRVHAVAGYRYVDFLFSGLTLCVDDLVTASAERSRGCGAVLFRWLQTEARTHGCTALTLDSGVQRTEAHRFYFRERMSIQGYHFSAGLEPEPGCG